MRLRSNGDQNAIFEFASAISDKCDKGNLVLHVEFFGQINSHGRYAVSQSRSDARRV